MKKMITLVAALSAQQVMAQGSENEFAVLATAAGFIIVIALILLAIYSILGVFSHDAKVDAKKEEDKNITWAARQGFLVRNDSFDKDD